jgi:hypothetical protein
MHKPPHNNYQRGKSVIPFGMFLIFLPLAEAGETERLFKIVTKKAII